jgi:membrane protein CcdC involved in cytochrome C biogenesis
MDIGSGNPLVTLVVVALVLVLVVARQFRERPVSGRQAVVPLVLTAVGLYTLVQAHPAVTALGVVLTAVELVATAGLGVLRGNSVRLFERDGVLMQRGGAPTLVLWVVTIGVRIGLGALAAALGAGALTSATLTLSFGISLLVQALVLQRRTAALSAVTGTAAPVRARIRG